MLTAKVLLVREPSPALNPSVKSVLVVYAVSLFALAPCSPANPLKPTEIALILFPPEAVKSFSSNIPPA